MKLDENFSEFIGLLHSRKVDFLIVGGHAVAFHGYPRLTGDIDFWIRPTADNAARLLRALDDFGFGSLDLTTDDFTEPGRVVQLGVPPTRIDLMTSISGVSFDEAWAGRVTGDLAGLRVHFLGKDALLRNKRASGRAKDLADLDELGDQ